MSTIVLKNADLLTMNDGPVIKHGDLWISDGKILKIDLYEKTAIPENEIQNPAAGASGSDDREIIDCTGCVVMPGLIDSHVHFDESYMGDFFLASGITSVRNMRGFEGHARWRDEILAGKRRGPYVYSSGPVYDGDDPTIIDNDNVILHTEEDVEEAIRYTKSHGLHRNRKQCEIFRSGYGRSVQPDEK